MRFIDLTHEITNTIKEYPDDPKTELNFLKRPTQDDPLTIMELKTGMHTGTHIDTSFHYIPNGNKITDLSIDDLCGKASIIWSDSRKISIPDEELEKIVIIITGEYNNFGSDEYFNKNPYLSNESADILIKNNVKVVALDTCSVDKYGENKIHKKLLKNNINIVENLTNTQQIKKDKYNAFFIPLKIESEASPIRAFVKRMK